MAVNLTAVLAENKGDTFAITYTAYFTSTYTLGGTGDNIDFTAANNPDGTSRNPFFLPGANGPARLPRAWSENGGDMNGAYVGIRVAGLTLATLKVKFYQANGTELTTGAAYPAGTPATVAASQLQITVEWNMGE